MFNQFDSPTKRRHPDSRSRSQFFWDYPATTKSLEIEVRFSRTPPPRIERGRPKGLRSQAGCNTIMRWRHVSLWFFYLNHRVRVSETKGTMRWRHIKNRNERVLKVLFYEKNFHHGFLKFTGLSSSSII